MMANLEESRGGVVAAGHPLTAEAGAEILRQGGNAFDAAIAAVMTAWVAESVLTSAGGGGFLLAHTSTGKNCLFDFFTQTPSQNRLNQTPDFYPICANFGDTVQEFHIGLGSIAVPGAVAGLLHVHQQLGKLPLAAIAEPAIYHAQHGVIINDFLAYVFTLLEPILTATPAAKNLYTSGGQLLTTGDTFKLPELANTLKLLVEKGASVFYEGAIAQRLVQDCQAQGGYLTAAALSNYQVIERSPLAVHYKDTLFLTNPPPSSGGALIAFALRLMANQTLAEYGHGSPEHLTVLTQAMARTNAARRDGYDSQLYDVGVAERFLADHHVALYQQGMGNWSNKLGSTTHISVVDVQGNAASVTTSNGEGAAYVIPGTGIMMNNMLGEEDLHPRGFHQWGLNQRISSMMAPSILLKEGRPQLVLGSGGSNRIRTAILQVITNMMEFGFSLKDAVRAPRLHWERHTLHLEPGYESLAVQSAQGEETQTVVQWQQQNMFFGGVHGVAIAADGQLHGAGDPRRGGAVAQG